MLVFKSSNIFSGKKFLVIAILDLGRNSVCNDHTTDLSNQDLIQEQGGQRLELIKWALNKLYPDQEEAKSYGKSKTPC